MSVSLTMWLVTIGAILVLVVMDFLTVSRKPHEVAFKEAALWSIFYIAMAVAFGVFIWTWQGSDFGTQYFAAYLVEKSLSVDNLFVFVIILGQFAVPSIYHQRVLLFGVVLALILRAIFIAIGAAALSVSLAEPTSCLISSRALPIHLCTRPISPRSRQLLKARACCLK